MNDLEFAAKAAGLEIHSDSERGLWVSANGLWVVIPDAGVRFWSPRDDDGDAFRLMTHLGLRVIYGQWAPAEIYSVAVEHDCLDDPIEELAHKDVDAATREAIFRAAVEIGKSLQEQPQ